MKRPRQRKTTKEVVVDIPKEDVYRLYVWCRWQEYSFDCEWTLEEMLRLRSLLMTKWQERIKLDSRTFRAESIDVIRIGKKQD